MSIWKPLVFSAIAAAAFVPGAKAPAQISVGIGVAPACPYGYFDYAPYDCAPYGYYGPDWLTAVCLSVLALGSMARMAFMAM